MITRRKLLKAGAATSLAYGFGGLSAPAIAQGAKIKLGYVSVADGSENAAKIGIGGKKSRFDQR